jgi:hypothetical protein
VRKGRWRGQGREDGDNLGRPEGRKGCPYRSSKRLMLRVFSFFLAVGGCGGQGLEFEQGQRKELNPVLVDLKTQFSDGMF